MILPVVMAFVALTLVMTAAFQTQKALNNTGWVDVFWTLGTGAAAVALALWPGPGLVARQVLVAGLAAIWSLRLALHVALRVAHSPEDARYVALRRQWGERFQARLLPFVLIQAPVGLLLALAPMLAARSPRPGLGATDLLGAAILLAAILGEGVADEQLRRFKADPANKGRICDRGLWGWSRHPNYFFEWLGWLAYPVIAWPPSGVYAIGWAAWAAPVLMYLVLDRGTGVPPLEAQMLASRGQAFVDYQARTSRFFPAPPRRSAV